MEKFDRFCQSCGMPMEKDPGKGGTNTDGSKTLKYCSHCYKSGEFIDGFKEVSEMKAVIKRELKKVGFGPVKRWLFTLHLGHLERWKGK